MDTIGVPELLLILVIVLLLFGVGRIDKIGGEIARHQGLPRWPER